MADAHPGPLSGLRVLEFSQVVAGPMVGLMLSDYGADVVKVEPPRGDSFRRTSSVVPGTSKSFQWYNRGKRGIVLNLVDERARAVVHRMVPNFDIVLINYRPGVAERVGIDYETLSKLREDLIYCRITGFGPEGPMSDMASSDIVAQAYSGVMAEDRQMDQFGAPRRITALPVGDLMASLSATSGVIAALYHRALTGEGQLVDTSMVRAAMGSIGRAVMREPVADSQLSDGPIAEVHEVFARGGSYAEAIEAYNRTGFVQTGLVRRMYHTAYEAKDGAIVVGALTPANRIAIRAVLGTPNEGSDDNPDFNALDPDTISHAAEIRREMQRVFKTRTVDEWMQAFRETGAPASPLRFPEELVEDAHTAPYFVDIEDPLSGPQKQLGPLVQFSKTPSAAQGPAPPLGYHTEEVLREEGISGEEIAELRSSGAIP